MHFPTLVAGARCLSTPAIISPESSRSSSLDRYTSYGPYGNSSIASSASSSTCSVFSYAESESSCGSSVDSDSGLKEFSPEQSWSNCNQPVSSSVEDVASKVLPYVPTYRHNTRPNPSSALAQPLPAHELRNARRTSRLVATPDRGISACTESLVRPPTLLRDTERKGNFVDCLVDTSAQMIEAYWPTTATDKCGLRSPYSSVLPLRTFIQETLRRSRTSFSTLQVALYYLVLIRPFLPVFGSHEMVPNNNKTLGCGRRTFLAALILASKYLQDRNYSTRAWSKISGLPTSEINVNEMAFLATIDWKLHISESIFEKWTKLILKYTPTTAKSLLHGLNSRSSDWQTLVMQLTPDLMGVNFTETACGKNQGAFASSRSSSILSCDSYTLSGNNADDLPPRTIANTRDQAQLTLPPCGYGLTPARCSEGAASAMSAAVRQLEQSRNCTRPSIVTAVRPLPIIKTYECKRKSSMSVSTTVDSDSSESESSETFEFSDEAENSEYTPYCTSAEQSPSSVASEYLSDSSESSCQSPVEVNIEPVVSNDTAGHKIILTSSKDITLKAKTPEQRLMNITPACISNIVILDSQTTPLPYDSIPNNRSNGRKRRYSNVVRHQVERTQSYPLGPKPVLATRPSIRGYYSKSEEHVTAIASYKTSPGVARKKLRCAEEDYAQLEHACVSLASY